MRAMSKLWHDCTNYVITRNEWEYVRKIVIDGVVYTDNQIQSASQSRGMIDGTFSIGNTVSAEFEATLIPNDNPQEIKIRDKVEFYVKIKTISNGDTEWFPFGTFYVEDAEMDGDYFKIKCYDKLAYLDDDFPLTSPTLSEALSEILYDSGLQLYGSMSSLSRLNLTLTKADKFTYREVLGYIGSLNCGNWYITEDDKLKLIKPGITGSPVIRVGKDNTKILKRKPTMLFDKFVVKRSENKGDKFIVGSGKRKFEVFNPWGDLTLASDVANQLSGYSIYPGDISSTEINPAVEIGDAAEVNGRLVQLSLVNYNTRMFLSFVSPTATEKFPQNLTIRDLEDRVSKLEEKMDNGGDNSCKTIELSDCDVLGNEITFPNRDYKTIEKFENSDGYCYNINKMSFGDIKGKKINLRLSQGYSDLDRKLVMKTPLDLRFTMTLNQNSLNDIGDFDTSKVKDMSTSFRVGDMRDAPTNFETLRSDSCINMSYMFQSTKHRNLKLSSMRTFKCKDMSGMFEDVEADILDISSFNTINVENMQFMFSNAKVKSSNKSTSLFLTPKVIDFSYMFYNSEWDELDISNFEFNFRYEYPDYVARKYTDMGSMFSGAKIGKLIMPTTGIYPKYVNVNTGAPDPIEYMFKNSQIDVIDLSRMSLEFERPDTINEFYQYKCGRSMFEGSKAKTIKMFEWKPNYEVIYYPKTDTVDGQYFYSSNTIDGLNMFKDCVNLTNLDLKGPLLLSNGMFANTPNLKGTIDCSLTKQYYFNYIIDEIEVDTNVHLSESIIEGAKNGTIRPFLNSGIDTVIVNNRATKDFIIEWGINERGDGTKVNVITKHPY